MASQERLDHRGQRRHSRVLMAKACTAYLMLFAKYAWICCTSGAGNGT